MEVRRLLRVKTMKNTAIGLYSDYPPIVCSNTEIFVWMIVKKIKNTITRL